MLIPFRDTLLTIIPFGIAGAMILAGLMALVSKLSKAKRRKDHGT
jgi:hypothetical protein